MKKLLASLLVLAMCAPAMAVTFSTSATDNVLTISYDLAEGEVLRGLALTVTNVSGDGVVAASTDYTAPAFNTFMDFAADVDNTYTAVGQGHPFAMITPDVANGQYEAAFPAGSFALSLGYLDENGIEPKGEGITADGVITVKFTGTTATEVAVALDTFRGGAVGDGLVITNNMTNVVLGFAPPECVASTAAFYNDWVAFGRPACWCYPKNCKGDADGRSQGNAITGYAHVYTNDLTVLAAAWNIKEPTKGLGMASINVVLPTGITVSGICADFNRYKQGNSITGYARVYTNDLPKLAASWNIKEPTKGVGIGDCAGPDYNFFTVAQ